MGRQQKTILRDITLTHTPGKTGSGPEVIKLFFMLNSFEMEFFSVNNMKMSSILIDTKMPTIVGIFIFIRNFHAQLC